MHFDTPERRRQLRLNRLKGKVIEALRQGAVLHFMYEKGPRWRLSTGRAVSPDVAQLVVASPSVRGDDALFPDARPQTFRLNSTL
jgi:hypothetical protein